MSVESTPDSGSVNPFSPTAVAKVMGVDSVVSVRTSAIVSALDAVDAYLAGSAPDPQGPEGEVLAVVGDYGTGKTHLAMQLLRHLRDDSAEPVEHLYLDATADSFLALYKRFVERLDHNGQLRRRVRRYYARIVADALPEGDLREELEPRLLDGRIDPVFVASHFDLGESAMQRLLRGRLHQVTADEQFAIALELLLREGFETAVWDWLDGKPPEPMLVERGITHAIDSDVDALRAMGVITMLFGGDESRFVLVIDELDKVVSTGDAPSSNAITAFKELLHVFIGAGSLLVLTVLPDVLTALGHDARERIGKVVRMRSLTDADTTELVEASQEAVFGERRLAPFANDVLSYLNSLGRGNVRQVIRLCHETYRRYQEGGRPITRQTVREAADERFQVFGLDGLRDRVADLLDAAGWTYLRDHELATDAAPVRVDFWITPVGSGPASAVLVVDPVFGAEAEEALHRIAVSIEAASRGTETLVVVNGLLEVSSQQNLGRWFGVEPLSTGDRGFDALLVERLRPMLRRAQGLAAEDPYRTLREEIDVLGRQQLNAQRYLEQIGTHVDSLRSTTDRQLVGLHRELTELAGTVRSGTPAAEVGPGVAVATPPDIDGLFVEALDTLTELDRFDAQLRDGFGIGPDEADAARPPAIRAGLRAETTVLAAGTAVLLQKIVYAFRDGVREWFRIYQAAGRPTPDRGLRDQLDWLCGTYDTLADALPTFNLAGLDQLTQTGPDRPDAVGRTALREYQGRVTEALQDLSARVRTAVLRYVDRS
jgi:Cdc6-like AAA superfamily ATPase